MVNKKYGAPDAPTTGGGVSTPAPATTGSQPAPSATTKNIDYGMGPGGSQTAVPAEDDNSFFQQHGERIFKHPRFKELTEYKQKYDGLQPVAEFVEHFGGLEEVQKFSQFFGPVYKHLLSKGDTANQAWQKLYPYLTKFLNDEDFDQAASQAMAEPQGEEPDLEDPKFKALNDKVQSLEGKLTLKEQRELQASRASNTKRYEDLLTAAFQKDGLPNNLKKCAANLVINELTYNPPRDHQGRPINPLDQFNEKFFDDAFSKTFLPFLKDVEVYTGEKLTKKSGDSGPSVPDTSTSGRTAAGKQVLPDRQAKADRLAQFIRSGQ